MAEDADVDIQPITRADFVPAKVFRSRSMNTRTGGGSRDLLSSLLIRLSTARCDEPVAVSQTQCVSCRVSVSDCHCVSVCLCVNKNCHRSESLRFPLS